MDRNTYADALKKQLEPNIYNHSLALEACMGGLYDYFQATNQLGDAEPAREEWTIAGLLHDIDFSGEYKAEHPKHTRDALAKYGLTISDTIHTIIQSHAPDLTGVKPHTKAEWSIFCADSLTGLIMAVAFILPSRKLADVKLSSVMKRLLKQPKFAAGTRRNEIQMCTDPVGLNLSVEKFVEICLNSMKAIAVEIGV